MAWFRNLKIRELPPSPPAQAAAPGPADMLPGKVFHSSQIPYKGDDTKKARRFFYGAEHYGVQSRDATKPCLARASKRTRRTRMPTRRSSSSSRAPWRYR